MSPSNRLDTFIELEEKLTILRVHYELCPDLHAKEVLEWAKFFLQWSRVLGEIGNPRCKNNFLKVNKLMTELSSSKSDQKAYEALEKAMAEAQEIVQESIFDFASPRRAS